MEQSGRSNTACTDPIVGAILSGWRYDISNIAPEMRTDYEQHLAECGHCQRRQTIARTIDVLLITVTSLSFAAFLLAAVVIHRLAMMPPIVGIHLASVHVPLHHTAIAISLEAVAIAGMVVSIVLWILVAIATPLPAFLSGVVQQRIPPDLRQRFTRRHA